MADEIRAEMVANVWKVVKAAGDEVAEGDTLVILESMKMEIPVVAESDGTVVADRGQRGRRRPGGRPDRDRRVTVVEYRAWRPGRDGSPFPGERHRHPPGHPATTTTRSAGFRSPPIDADGQLGPGTDYASVLADVATRASAGEVLVATGAAGEVLGSVLFVLPGSRYAELSRAGEAEFRMLAVDPAARAGAWGRRWSRRASRGPGPPQASALVICVRDFSVPAQRLYRRLGLRPAARAGLAAARIGPVARPAVGARRLTAGQADGAEVGRRISSRATSRAACAAGRRWPPGRGR